MFNYPYLPVEGLHEFNLDWILARIKKYDEELQETILNFLTKNLTVDLTLEYRSSDECVLLHYNIGGAEDE